MSSTRHRLAALAAVRATAAGDTDALNEILRRANAEGAMVPLFGAVLELAANTATTAAEWRGTSVERLLEATEMHVMKEDTR